MTQLVSEHARIEPVEPILYLLEKFERRLLREVAFILLKGNGDFQLLCQRQVDREDGTKLVPLFLPRGFWPCWSRVECGSSFVHGCVAQSHNPCVNLTATAFRPSWYCTATTVASAAVPARESRCTRTWSSNSNGSVDRKIACCAPPNSKTVTSRSLAPPPRSAVTCTGTRTTAEPGKKRASCPAQSTSCSLTVISVERFTQPLALPTQRLTVSADLHTRTAAKHSVPAMRNARRTPKRNCREEW